jgi:hypothetical protein
MRSPSKNSLMSRGEAAAMLAVSIEEIDELIVENILGTRRIAGQREPLVYRVDVTALACSFNPPKRKPRGL